MVSFGISLSGEDLDLPKLYWILKLHKNPYQQCNLADVAKYSAVKASLTYSNEYSYSSKIMALEVLQHHIRNKRCQSVVDPETIKRARTNLQS